LEDVFPIGSPAYRWFCHNATESDWPIHEAGPRTSFCYAQSRLRWRHDT